MIEPVDPGQGRQLNRVDTAPWALLADQLRFVQAVDRLSQCVVVGVANASDGWSDANISQPLRVSDSDILNAAIAVVN